LDDLKKQLSDIVLISLTDDNGLEIQQDIIDAAINSADAEINGYAQAQYDVPFNPVPEIIKKMSVDITIFNLFSRRGEIGEKDSNISMRYKSAIRFLENLAKNLVTIGKPDPAPPIGANFKSNPRIFNRDSMNGM
jgi:phage gp36-like protein